MTDHDPSAVSAASGSLPKHGMTLGDEGGPGSWAPHYGTEPTVSEFNPGPEKIDALREQVHDADKREGLYGKYRVERISDPTGKHSDCRYFVLDPQHDPLAREALEVYAEAARAAGYGPLADDLEAWIGVEVVPPMDFSALYEVTTDE